VYEAAAGLLLLVPDLYHFSTPHRDNYGSVTESGGLDHNSLQFRKHGDEG
jgi:hypothetical protein